jgi:hypothetical protein
MTKTRFTTGVGRLVQGSVDEPQTKDAQGNLRVVKTGPNVGQPNPQFFIAVAFPKADPQGEFAAFWQILCQQAAADFPALFPQGPTGQSVHPQFSFKVIDGDGLDQNAKPNSDKEGFAGHWVVRFASAYPPRCFHAGRYAAHEQIQEKGAIKRGYYVRVSGTVDGNANTQRPGLYLNLDMVELSAYGPEITSGPDASQAFAGGPAALPPGASATPVGAPAAPGAPALPGNAAPGAPALPGNAAPGAPSYPGAASPVPASPAAPPAPGAPAAPAAPYTGYMGAPAAPAPGPTPGAPAASPPAPAVGAPASPTAYPGSAAPGVPAVPGAPAAPPAPAAHVMLPAANGATYEQMIAAGWTDDTLRQHGMMQ